MSLSRCNGVIGCHSPSCGRVRNCGWYCQGGNCRLSCCHRSHVASSACAWAGGGRPRSVGACVVRQWNRCLLQSTAGVSQSFTCMDGWIIDAMGLWSLWCPSCSVQCSVKGVDPVSWWLTYFQSASSHQSRGLEVTCPSAASTTMGSIPHWVEMSRNCSCMSRWGSTFSIRDRIVYVGNCCRMVRSMFVICWINDPSLPETPGGASRTREWSLHGGAEVMRMTWELS